MAALPCKQRYFSLPRSTPATASSLIPPPPVAATAPVPLAPPAKPAKCNHHQLSKGVSIRGESIGGVIRINESCEGMEIVKNKKKKKGSEGNYDGKESRKLNWLAMNANFQGVNNSFLFNSSFTQGDAGLHFYDI